MEERQTEQAQKDLIGVGINWWPYCFRFVLPLAICVCACVYLVFMVGSLTADASQSPTQSMDKMLGRSKMVYQGSYSRDFNDLNDKQLLVAKELGINPIETRNELNEAEKKMLLVSTNEYFVVDKLTHSVPYLVPDAKRLLDRIGEAFQNKMKAYGQEPFRLIVTSLTRSEKDVKRLSKRNANASENSTHCYGTTFDISWVRFAAPSKCDSLSLERERLNDGMLKAVLAQVLKELKDEGLCYVKHERRQACFHITVATHVS